MDSQSERLGSLMAFSDLGLILSTFGVLLAFNYIVEPVSTNTWIVCAFFVGIKILIVGIADITGIGKSVIVSMIFILIANAVIILINQLMAFGLSLRMLLIMTIVDLVVVMAAVLIWKSYARHELGPETSNEGGWVYQDEMIGTDLPSPVETGGEKVVPSALNDLFAEENLLDTAATGQIPVTNTGVLTEEIVDYSQIDMGSTSPVQTADEDEGIPYGTDLFAPIGDQTGFTMEPAPQESEKSYTDFENQLAGGQTFLSFDEITQELPGEDEIEAQMNMNKQAEGYTRSEEAFKPVTEWESSQASTVEAAGQNNTPESIEAVQEETKASIENIPETTVQPEESFISETVMPEEEPAVSTTQTETVEVTQPVSIPENEEITEKETVQKVESSNSIVEAFREAQERARRELAQKAEAQKELEREVTIEPQAAQTESPSEEIKESIAETTELKEEPEAVQETVTETSESEERAETEIKVENVIEETEAVEPGIEEAEIIPEYSTEEEQTEAKSKIESVYENEPKEAKEAMVAEKTSTSEISGIKAESTSETIINEPKNETVEEITETEQKPEENTSGFAISLGETSGKVEEPETAGKGFAVPNFGRAAESKSESVQEETVVRKPLGIIDEAAFEDITGTLPQLGEEFRPLAIDVTEADIQNGRTNALEETIRLNDQLNKLIHTYNASLTPEQEHHRIDNDVEITEEDSIRYSDRVIRNKLRSIIDRQFVNEDVLHSLIRVVNKISNRSYTLDLAEDNLNERRRIEKERQAEQKRREAEIKRLQEEEAQRQALLNSRRKEAEERRRRQEAIHKEEQELKRRQEERAKQQAEQERREQEARTVAEAKAVTAKEAAQNPENKTTIKTTPVLKNNEVHLQNDDLDIIIDAKDLELLKEFLKQQDNN